MTNHHTKFEVPRPKRSLVFDQTHFYLQDQWDLNL
jgi:hypothetical protein